MGSEKSHFSVSLIVRDEITKLPTKECRSGLSPSAYQRNALPLGQTGSRFHDPTGILNYTGST